MIKAVLLVLAACFVALMVAGMTGCGTREYKCGTVTAKYQTGRFNEYFHLGVTTEKGYTYIADVTESTWAAAVEGQRFCGNIGPYPQ